MYIMKTAFLHVAGTVHGLTLLGDTMYVVFKKSAIIKMYEAETLSPLGESIHVEGMKDPNDIVACHRDNQLYIADEYCIWRVSVDDRSHMTWLSTMMRSKFTLSLTLSLASDHLIKASEYFNCLHQYSTYEQPVYLPSSQPTRSYMPQSQQRHQLVLSRKLHATSQPVYLPSGYQAGLATRSYMPQSQQRHQPVLSRKLHATSQVFQQQVNRDVYTSFIMPELAASYKHKHTHRRKRA